MGVYKKGIISTIILIIVSLLLAIYLNYYVEEQFFCNICIGVLSSSVLTCIVSIIDYFAERKNILEVIYMEVNSFTKLVNNYQEDLSLDQKIDLFINISNYNLTTLNIYIGKLDFFNNNNRKYIYKEIYNRIIFLQKKVLSHEWHFRMHKNGTARNVCVMKKFVNELEPYILEKINHQLSSKSNEQTNIINVRNKFVDKMIHEINDHYFEIMKGKRKTKDIQKNTI